MLVMSGETRGIDCHLILYKLFAKLVIIPNIAKFFYNKVNFIAKCTSLAIKIVTLHCNC